LINDGLYARRSLIALFRVATVVRSPSNFFFDFYVSSFLLAGTVCRVRESVGPGCRAVQDLTLRADRHIGQHDVHTDVNESRSVSGHLSAVGEITPEDDDPDIVAAGFHLRHATIAHLYTGGLISSRHRDALSQYQSSVVSARRLWLRYPRLHRSTAPFTRRQIGRRLASLEMLQFEKPSETNCKQLPT
jgi:hypothetical protein